VARELSVLVACGGAAEQLAGFVDRTQRTLARAGLDAELVLVDDGGGAAVGAAVDDLAGAHPNVVGLHHDRRRGPLACWTSALAQASGRLTSTLDAGAGHRPEALVALCRELGRAEVVQAVRRPLRRAPASPRSGAADALVRAAMGTLVRAIVPVRGADPCSTFLLTTRDVLADGLAHAERFAAAPGLLAAVLALRGYGIRPIDTAADAPVVARDPALALLRTALALRAAPPLERSVATALGGEPAPSRPRRAAARHLGELRQSQWLAADALRALQRGRLEALLRHAARHVEHYRVRFERLGLDAGDGGLVDLAELPLLERAALCEDPTQALVSPSRDPARAHAVVTAGATGEPREVWIDVAELPRRAALEARHREWVGARGVHARLAFGTPLAGVRARLERARGGLAVVAIGDGDQARVDGAVARLERLRPSVLEGSVEALALVASRAATLPVGAVVAYGQTLDAGLRARLAAVFGARVFDRYVSRALGPIAQECDAHAGLHVNVETHVVEILRDGRVAEDGHDGEVVVTDLGNRVMPLVRHRTGDQAALVRDPCACGRASPRLVGLRGRPPVWIRGDAGRLVPAGVFAELFRAYAAVVRRHQVVQEDDGRVVVRIVRKPGWAAATEAELRGALRELLGGATPVELALVEWLAPDAAASASQLAAQPPFAL